MSRILYISEGIGKRQGNGTSLRELYAKLHGSDSQQGPRRIVDFNLLRGRLLDSSIIRMKNQIHHSSRDLRLQQWYTAQIQMLCNWLSERLDHSLHLYQCTCLAHIVKKIYSDFELQGVMEEKLNTKTYQTIEKRMKTEEATCALNMSAQNEE